MTDTSEPAAIAETHISVIVFIGDRAYKLKKPVSLGFLDFARREDRERACHAEVALNRRLAPDVYLGVDDVVGPDGEIVDHLVVMRRMPTDRRLSTLVEDGDPEVEGHLLALAHLLAGFHRAAARGPIIDDAASRDATRANWDEGFEQVRAFVGGLFDADVSARIEHLVHRYLDGRSALFAERLAAGRACDGHGDLQAADIYCLDDGPRVLDCIEFADRFRHGDVMADVAFLAMDLDRLGAPELGAAFLDEYRRLTGDDCPTSLLEHFVAYRAHVRAKVNALRSAQTEGAEASTASTEAVRLLHMTHRYLESARVRLVLVGGLPGTGKSTVARALGDRQGWSVLRSDEVRKEAAGLLPTDRTGAGFGEGIYDTESTDAVYRDLLERAGRRLARGECVVVDASWTAERHRASARAVAEEHAADLVELRCVAPSSITEQRMVERARAGRDASDATPEIARRLAQTADPWPGSMAIDTSGSVEATVESTLEALGVATSVDDVAR
jgi:aminoglycoside phosphotransferase family enzyme/predicted kinase